mmetsp:Transcript_9833/g.19372  ORF Transcript_9833/g.19372 Transcript_9833/m.19372 type:complete len:345 (+) Transcript_9833:630-1664(+)
MKWETTVVVFLLGGFGIGIDEGLDALGRSSIEARAMEGKPSVLIASRHSFGEGFNESLDDGLGRREDTGLVQWQEPQIAIVSLGDDPCASLVREHDQSTGHSIPIFLENQPKQNGAVLVVHFPLPDRSIRHRRRRNCRTDRPKPRPHRRQILVVQPDSEILHRFNDHVLILRIGILHQIQRSAPLLILGIDAVGIGIQQGHHHPPRGSVPTSQMNRQHPLIVDTLGRLGIRRDQRFDQRQGSAKHAGGMKREESPSDLVRVFGFPTRDPRLCFHGGGASAFDGGFPVFVLDEGVELGGAEVIVGFGLVLVAGGGEVVVVARRVGGDSASGGVGGGGVVADLGDD